MGETVLVLVASMLLDVVESWFPRRTLPDVRTITRLGGGGTGGLGGGGPGGGGGGDGGDGRGGTGGLWRCTISVVLLTLLFVVLFTAIPSAAASVSLCKLLTVG